MELLKDILKWGVYSAPLVVSLSWIWIAVSVHRYVGKMEG